MIKKIKNTNFDIIAHLIFRDNLTGLKNRTSFEKETEEIIGENIPFTLYYLDFDNFKNLNDIYGYKCGDLFLKNYSKRLLKQFPSSLIYRWCGDEFLIVDRETEEIKCLNRISEIMNFTKQKWMIGEIEHYPSVSIGLTRFPRDGKNIEELLKNIDVAMGNAKSKGKSRASEYSKSFKNEIEKRISVGNKISSDLINEGFILNFQPIYDMKDEKVVAIEALLRCKSNELKVGTGDLIAVAEETGQVVSIDFWVVENVFNFISKNLKDKNIITAINISSKTLTYFGFVEFLKDMLDKYKINASSVEFELTEYSLVDDIEYSKNLMKELKNLGFKISLDDFGTRYSSINYLVNMPFDTLKIDKSYVDKIIEEKNSKAVVELIIKCSKEVGLETIAEGVESKEQFQLLKSLGCNFCQGYLLNKPMEAEKLLNLREFRR